MLEIDVWRARIGLFNLRSRCSSNSRFQQYDEQSIVIRLRRLLAKSSNKPEVESVVKSTSITKTSTSAAKHTRSVEESSNDATIGLSSSSLMTALIRLLVILIFLQLIRSGDVEMNPGPGLRDKPSMSDLYCFKYTNEKNETEKLFIIDTVAKEWIGLGYALNFSNSEIDHIKTSEHDNDKKCCHELLKCWLQRPVVEGDEVSWSTLLEAFDDTPCTGLAIQLRNVICDKGTEKSSLREDDDDIRAGVKNDTSVVVGSVKYGVPEQVLDRICSDNCFSKVAKRLTNWEAFSIYIGLTETELAQLKVDQHTEEMRKVCMLQLWRSKSGSNATYRKLVEAFQENHNAELASYIIELLQHKSYDFSNSGGYHLSPLDAYSIFLKSAYITEKSSSQIDFPHMPEFLYINLVLAKEDKPIRRGRPNQEALEEVMSGRILSAVGDRQQIKVADIFEVCSGHCKFVLVEGAPGGGKTTLCEHIALEWAKNKLFSEFSVVICILVKLRDPAVHNVTCLSDILPVPSGGDSCVLASQIGQVNGCNTLIILDGWDELPVAEHTRSFFRNLIIKPGHLNLKDVTVLITSRPDSSANIHSLVSARIEILGFTSEQRLQYFKNCFANDDLSYGKFIEAVNINPSAESMSYSPLTAAILVHLFQSLEGNLPSKHHELYIAFLKCRITRWLKKHRDDTFELDDDEFLGDHKNMILPEPLNAGLLAMAKLAFTSNQLVFNSSHLKEAGVNSGMLFDLMISVQSIGISSPHTVTHNFLHKTIQDFLAAYYITTLPNEEQLKKLENLILLENTTIIEFYCGLNSLRVPGSVSLVIRLLAAGNVEVCINILVWAYISDNQLLWNELIPKIRNLYLYSPIRSVAAGYYLALLTSANTHTDSREDTDIVTLGSAKNMKLMINSFMSSSPSKCVLQVNFVRVSSCEECCLAMALASFCKKFSYTKGFLSIKCINSLRSHVKLPHCRLKELSFTNCHSYEFTADHCAALGEALKAMHLLTHLNLSLIQLSDSVIQFICDGLINNSSLECLALKQCNLSSKSAECLACLLSHQPVLTSLDLSYNPIGSYGATFIADALKVSSSLQNFFLRSCEITSEGAGSLACLLSCQPIISKLDLSDNPISSFGAIQVFEALKYKTLLQYLNLSDCIITAEGGGCLAALLFKPHGLIELDVSNNPLGSEGVAFILDALIHNTTLECLDISHCGIEGTSLVATVSGLMFLSHCQVEYNGSMTIANKQSILNISHFDISHSCLDAIGTSLIADMLQSNTHLTYLYLEHCNIGSVGLLKLGNALMANGHHLTLLDISNNLGIDYESWLEFSELVSSSKMKCLKILGCFLEGNNDNAECITSPDSSSHITEEDKEQWSREEITECGMTLYLFSTIIYKNTSPAMEVWVNDDEYEKYCHAHYKAEINSC